MNTEAWTHWENQVVHGTFPVRRLLGSSTWSAVFLTEHKSKNLPDAALKLVRADAPHAKDQLAQWEAAAALSHPSLVRLLNAGRCQLDGQEFLFVVMEHADQTLAQILRHRALSAEETRELMLPTLEALAFLHRNRRVHGQLKPSNFLAVNDQLKLASDTIRSAGYANGMVRATPYDPPELGEIGCSAAGDMWSLGVTLLETLTQRAPTWFDLQSRTPLLAGSLPAPFSQTVRRCLSVDPAERPTAAELRAQYNPAAEAEAKSRPAPQPPAQQISRETAPPQPREASPKPASPQARETSSEITPPQARAASLEPTPVQTRETSPKSTPPQVPEISRDAALSQTREASPKSAPPQAREISPDATPAQARDTSTETTPPRTRETSTETTPSRPRETSLEVIPPQARETSPTASPSRTREISPNATPSQARESAPKSVSSQAKETSREANPPQSPPGRGLPLKTLAAAFVVTLAVWAGMRFMGTSQDESQPPVAAVPAPVTPPPAFEKPAVSDAQPSIPVSQTPAQPSPPPTTSSVLHEVTPDVPPKISDKIRGRIYVTVRVLVAPSGNVVGALMEDPGPSKYFARLADNASREWQFTPAESEGDRVWLLRFEFRRDGVSTRAIAQ